MSRPNSGQLRVVGALAVVVVTAAAVVVGIHWDSDRSNVAESEAASPTLNLAPEASLPIAVTRQPGVALKAYFVGDEVSAGQFASSEGNNFRSVMVRDLEKTGPVDPIWTERDDATPNADFALADNASGSDVIVVELGSNDAVSNVGIEPFSIKYGALLDDLKVQSPKAAIICAGTWLPTIPGRSYDYAIQTQCTARGAKFRQLVDLYDDPANRGPKGVQTAGAVSDGLKPNDRGHAAIAARLMEILAVGS